VFFLLLSSVLRVSLCDSFSPFVFPSVASVFFLPLVSGL